jgi:hypothetical protein
MVDHRIAEFLIVALVAVSLVLMFIWRRAFGVICWRCKVFRNSTDDYSRGFWGLPLARCRWCGALSVRLAYRH